MQILVMILYFSFTYYEEANEVYNCKMLDKIFLILKILRVRDWLKNIVILFPIVFSGKIITFNIDQYIELIINFINFSLLTSTIYIFNDINDKQEDALNQYKKTRPIASGQISTSFAFATIAFLFFVIFSNFLIFDLNFLEFYFFYIFNNILYNFYLKKINILNSLTIGVGFLIRLYFGGGLNNIRLEPWLISLVFLGAFSLSLIKKLSDKKESNEVEGLLIQDNMFINLSFVSMVLIYILHFYISVEFTILNQLISISLFSISLFLIKVNIKRIKHSVDTIQILTNDINFLFILFLWFSHYYFCRYL